MIDDESGLVDVATTSSQSAVDKTHVETGNSELNQLMNGNMFASKAISNKWVKHEFKDNLVKNLHCRLETGNYFQQAYTGPNSDAVNVNWKDRSGDIKVGNTELIAKGINMDVYPKAIHEFYNYSVEAIYHIIEVAAGFVFDTYKKYVDLRSMGDENSWKKYINSSPYKGSYINSFNSDDILPYTDIKGTYDPNDPNDIDEFETTSKFPEFKFFIERLRAFNNGASPYAKLNPDEYVNVVSALRNELVYVGRGDSSDSPIINLDIQNNNYDVSMMKTNNRFVADDVSIQIVPYILNILFDSNDSVKNGVPIVGYNVYIGFESVCDAIISAIRWDKSVNNSDTKVEFVTNVLNSNFISKQKIHEKIANTISLFLFTNVHKVHDTFNSFLTLTEDYYENLIKHDPDINNLISKVRYCLADTTKLDIDKLIKGSIIECIKEYGSITVRPENMINELNDVALDVNNKEQLNRLLYLIYARAFSMLNEDSFVVNAWDSVIATTPYDESESITKINGIDDYFLKDFFSNLFTNIHVVGLENKNFSYIEGNEKTGLNGEKISKKYVRTTHHFYIMLGMTINIFGNLMLSLRDIDINSYTDTKMFKILAKIKYDVDDAFATILKGSLQFLVSSYLNPVAVVHQSSLFRVRIGNYGNARYSYSIIQINSALDLFNKYSKFNTSEMNWNLYEKIERLFEQYYKTQKVKIVPTNNPVFTSYNTSELISKFRNVTYDKNSETAITTREPTTETIDVFIKNILNNFIKSGLISLESSDGYF